MKLIPEVFASLAWFCFFGGIILTFFEIIFKSVKVKITSTHETKVLDTLWLVILFSRAAKIYFVGAFVSAVLKFLNFTFTL